MESLLSGVGEGEGLPGFRLDGLTGHLQGLWFDARRNMDERISGMLESLRQRRGEYDPQHLAEIAKLGGSKAYIPLVDGKCNVLDAWLSDVFLRDHLPPFKLKATPIPELPPEVDARIGERLMQKVQSYVEEVGGGQAPDPSAFALIRQSVMEEVYREQQRESEYRIEREERYIRDQLVEGDYRLALRDVLQDVVTYDLGWMKGPVPEMRRRFVWKGGKWKVERKLVERWHRASPFFVYPEPGIEKVEDGYLFERHVMTRRQVEGMIGVPGFDDERIKGVLATEDYVDDSLDLGTYSVKETLEKKGTFREWGGRGSGHYEVLSFWGEVPGRLLIEWGYEGDVEDYEAVPVNCWMIGSATIKAVKNPHPLGLKPFFKASFRDEPGSLFGKGLPEILRGVERGFLASIRHMLNNLAIASGPQVMVYREALPTSEDVLSMFPWKVWEVAGDPSVIPSGQGRGPVQFHNPDPNAHLLIQVAQYFSQLADEVSGIPGYIGGDSDLPSSIRTAGQTSMLMQSAGRTLRKVAGNVDALNQGAIKYLRGWNWAFHKEDLEEGPGDAEVSVGGVNEVAMQEQSPARLIEFLQATANEFDMQVLGPDARRTMLYEVAKALKVPASSQLVPSATDVMTGWVPPAGPPGGGEGGGPGGGSPVPQGTGAAPPGGMPPGGESPGVGA